MLQKPTAGFDHLTAANLNELFDNSTGTVTTPGVFGLGSSLIGYNQLTATLSANFVTGFFSFDFFTGTLAACNILALFDGSTLQSDLRMASGGALSFTRNGTTLGSASTSLLASNSWYPVVIKFKIDDTVGIVEVRINGSAFVALTSQDTKNTANAFFNKFVLDTSSNRTQGCDNFVWWDDTAGVAGSNDLSDWPTAPVTVNARWVASAGSNADFTPSASTNASNVDDKPNHDGDSTYNSSLTTGNIDTFTVDSMHPTSGTVIAHVINTIDRIDDATPHTLQGHILSVAATADGTAYSSSASFKNHQTIFVLDPNTAAAPTVSASNSMKYGYKLAS